VVESLFHNKGNDREIKWSAPVVRSSQLLPFKCEGLGAPQPSTQDLKVEGLGAPQPSTQDLKVEHYVLPEWRRMGSYLPTSNPANIKLLSFGRSHYVWKEDKWKRLDSQLEDMECLHLSNGLQDYLPDFHPRVLILDKWGNVNFHGRMMNQYLQRYQEPAIYGDIHIYHLKRRVKSALSAITYN